MPYPLLFYIFYSKKIKALVKNDARSIKLYSFASNYIIQIKTLFVNKLL